MTNNEQILRVLDARDEGFKTQLDYVGNSIGYGRAIQLLGQLWDDMLQARYPDMSRHQESMHRRTDIERIEAGLPIGRKVVYVPKRARKGVISITCWGPHDAEIPPAARIISDTPLYGQTLAATAPESAPAQTEAPVYQYRQKAGVNEWIECDARCEARMKTGPAADCFEYRTLYTSPAPSQSADRYKLAFDEWLEKTEWVQAQHDSFPFRTLGIHRADIMRQEIERLRALSQSTDQVRAKFCEECLGFGELRGETCPHCSPALAATESAEPVALDEEKLLKLVCDWEGSQRGEKARAAWNRMVAYIKNCAAPDRAPSIDSATVCTWTLDDDESGTWASSCGELWSFIDGGPKENRVSYCHHCGKPAAIAAMQPQKGK